MPIAQWVECGVWYPEVPGLNPGSPVSHIFTCIVVGYMVYCGIDCGLVAQLVEQGAHNTEVSGSSPDRPNVGE